MTTKQNPNQDHRRRNDIGARRRRRGWGGLAIVCLAAGLLLWVRIRLITDFPRMAIADEAPATTSDVMHRSESDESTRD